MTQTQAPSALDDDDLRAVRMTTPAGLSALHGKSRASGQTPVIALDAFVRGLLPPEVGKIAHSSVSLALPQDWQQSVTDRAFAMR